MEIIVDRILVGLLDFVQWNERVYTDENVALELVCTHSLYFTDSPSLQNFIYSS